MLRTLPLADEQILPQAKRESYFFNRIGRVLPFTTFSLLSSATCIPRAAGRSPQIKDEKQRRKIDYKHQARAWISRGGIPVGIPIKTKK